MPEAIAPSGQDDTRIQILQAAIVKADQCRRRHQVTVELTLQGAEDGTDRCVFRDQEGVVVAGCPGQSLLEAVTNTASIFVATRLMTVSADNLAILDRCVKGARSLAGHARGVYCESFSVFTTADFGQALEEDQGVSLDVRQCVAILGGCKTVVRVAPDLWYILPGLRRHE